MKETILSARGLCKSYAHNGGQNHILDHIDIDIYKADFTVIMGASGSGKSTLLYTISGMDPATAGQVIYKGDNIASYKEDKLAKLRQGDFGFVFQQMHLVSNLTLFENVAVTGYLNKSLTGIEVNKRTQRLLEHIGLKDMAKRLPSQVSGGEQQRAAIARAIVNTPSLLFADEPTGALNRKNSIEVLNLMTEINRDEQSILMVTHDMKAALRASRLLYLEDGKIIGELSLPPFTPEEEKSREKQIDAWLSSMEW
jgi:putative ABC transport system ATP-binding protein